MLPILNTTIYNVLYPHSHSQNSERVQNRFFSFMNPLAWEIWFYIGCAYFLVSLTMWIVARFSPIEWQLATNTICTSTHANAPIVGVRHTNDNTTTVCPSANGDCDGLRSNRLASLNSVDGQYCCERDGDAATAPLAHCGGSAPPSTDINIMAAAADADDDDVSELLLANDDVRRPSSYFDECHSDDDDCMGHNNCSGETELICIENGFTLTNSFWFSIGSLMQQGSDLNPKVCMRGYYCICAPQNFVRFYMYNRITSN